MRLAFGETLGGSEGVTMADDLLPTVVVGSGRLISPVLLLAFDASHSDT